MNGGVRLGTNFSVRGKNAWSHANTNVAAKERPCVGPEVRVSGQTRVGFSRAPAASLVPSARRVRGARDRERRRHSRAPSPHPPRAVSLALAPPPIFLAPSLPTQAMVTSDIAGSSTNSTIAFGELAAPSEREIEREGRAPRITDVLGRRRIIFGRRELMDLMNRPFRHLYMPISFFVFHPPPPVFIRVGT